MSRMTRQNGAIEWLIVWEEFLFQTQCALAIPSTKGASEFNLLDVLYKGTDGDLHNIGSFYKCCVRDVNRFLQIRFNLCLYSMSCERSWTKITIRELKRFFLGDKIESEYIIKFQSSFEDIKISST